MHWISNFDPTPVKLERVRAAIECMGEDANKFEIFEEPMPRCDFDEDNDDYHYEAALKAGLWSIAATPEASRELINEFFETWCAI